MADSDLIPSLVRTWVPVAVGGVISWLATQNLQVSGGTQDALATLLTSVVIALYYTVARVLEQKWPALGLLLGSTKQPAYGSTAPQSPSAAVEAPVDPPVSAAP